MEGYKQIAKEAGVSIESVRELMARTCVKRVETPYYRTTEDGRKVDARCFTSMVLLSLV